MARKLPPLNALRAFEAAARQLSFTRAAEELHVTQAAISHQVKALEERLGVDLFVRAGRTLALTEAGERYLPTVRDAFDAIAAATARLYDDDHGGRLTVSTIHSFATAWLFRRLPAFRARHPEIDLLLDSEDRLVDFARDAVDLAIRYGGGGWPGLREEKLLEEEIFPVCSPALLDGDRPLNDPADLAHHTLIYDDMKVNWPAWLAAAGVPGLEPAAEIGYTDSHMILAAALAGQGVALARSILVGDELRAGRLVRPFAIGLSARFAYYVVAPAATWDRPKIKLFRAWLVEEAAAYEAGREPDAPPTRDSLSGPVRA